MQSVQLNPASDRTDSTITPTPSDRAPLSSFQLPSQTPITPFDYLKEIRQVLNRDDAHAAPFGFHVAHHGYYEAANGGLGGMVNRACDLVRRFGANSIAHHAWDIADAAANILLATPGAHTALSPLHTEECEGRLISLKDDFHYLRDLLNFAQHEQANNARTQATRLTLDTLIRATSNPEHSIRPIDLMHALGYLDAELSLEGEIFGGKTNADINERTTQIADQILSLNNPIPMLSSLYRHLCLFDMNGNSGEEKLDHVVSELFMYTKLLESHVERVDQALWFRDSRTYNIFPRTFNLSGFCESRGIGKPEGDQFLRDFPDQAFELLKQDGLNQIYLLGINPLGQKHALGTAGGSPFCVKDLQDIDPQHGSFADFQRFIARAHHCGITVMTDVVANHTSFDSRMLSEDPSYFVHLKAIPLENGQSTEQSSGEFYQPPPEGYRFYYHSASATGYYIRMAGYFEIQENRRVFYEDVAQLDLFNPKTRERFIQGTLDFLEKSSENSSGRGIDALRVDMAHHLLSAKYKVYGRGADCPNEHPVPETEFLAELISAIKARFPHVAIVAECHEHLHDLRLAGFDAFLNKNDMPGHSNPNRISVRGWYDAIASRDSTKIAQAIENLMHHEDNIGEPLRVRYPADHDLPPLLKELIEPSGYYTPDRNPTPRPELLRPLTALTLLSGTGPVLLVAGHETVSETAPHRMQVSDGTRRYPSFEQPTVMSWGPLAESSSRTYRDVFADSSTLLEKLGSFRVSETFLDGEVVGFIARPRSSSSSTEVQGAVIVANLGEKTQKASLPIEVMRQDGKIHDLHLNVSVGSFDYAVQLF